MPGPPTGSARVFFRAEPALAVGFVLGLSQFVLAWFLTWRYLRVSAREFSGLEDRVRLLAQATAVEVAR